MPAAGAPGMVEGVHLCGAVQPLSPATIADIEGFARSLLAGRAGGLGLVVERRKEARVDRWPRYLRIARLYLVLLAIFAVARFAQGAMGVDYAKAHHVFSIFMLTVMASVFYAAFCRRWRGFRLAAGRWPWGRCSASSPRS